MRIGKKIPGVALCASMLAASSGVAAQGRYELLGGDGVGAVEGLRIYTIRDNRMATCYTLFVLGSRDGESSGTTGRDPGLTADDYQKLRTASTLKEAAAIRDQKIAGLRSTSAGWSTEKDVERERIEDEYESVVRSVLPRVYPPGRLDPSWRSTTTDELNQAVRQAIADGDAVNAAADRAGSDDQLMQAITRIGQSPRLAVAGPVACAPPAGTAR